MRTFLRRNAWKRLPLAFSQAMWKKKNIKELTEKPLRNKLTQALPIPRKNLIMSKAGKC